MTVGELQTRMTSAEFAEWMAFDRIDPFGEARGDVRSGVLAALIANIHRDRKKRAEPYSALDFMPFLRREQEIGRFLAARGENMASRVRNLFNKGKKGGGDGD